MNNKYNINYTIKLKKYNLYYIFFSDLVKMNYINKTTIVPSAQGVPKSLLNVHVH